MASIRYPFSPELLDAMPERLAELYRGLELRLLKEITDRLILTGQLNEVTVQSIRVLRSHGVSLDEIKEAIKTAANIENDELDKLFDDVVDRNQEYYSDLIDLAGITKPDELVNASDVAAIMKQTKEEVSNITQSMGFLVDGGRTKLEPADAYQWALDRAITEINSGAISYNQAIANATQQLADSGLRTVFYESGHTDQIDVAVRRAVMTGITQVCDKYTDESAEYLDSPYVELSAHSGARDKPYPHKWSSHKDWQGKVYYQSKNGEPDPLGKYPDLVEETGYGEVDGLCGANCRHRRHVWIEGISKRSYTDEQLANIDPPPFEYDSKTYTHYEATQMQRSIEREIRKWKRREACAVTPEEKQAYQIRINRLRKKYDEFTKAAGLRSQIERANVYQPKSFTGTEKQDIIKALDVDDYKLATENSGLTEEVKTEIFDTIKEYETKGGVFFAEVRTGDFYDLQTGKPAFFQTDLNDYGQTILNINTQILGNKSLEEVNSLFADTKKILPNSLREAIIHECGHARAYLGKTAQQIAEMNQALAKLHFRGISKLARRNGAEAIAEIEVLLSRNQKAPKDAWKIYKKYTKGRDVS